MKKEQLSEAIREGINNSRADLAKQILIAMAIIAVILSVLFLIGKYQSYKYEKEHCPNSVCPPMTMAPESRCADDNEVHCYAIDKDIEQQMMNGSSNGGGFRPVVAEGQFCGYTEANAWFEQYKQKVLANMYLDCGR